MPVRILHNNGLFYLENPNTGYISSPIDVIIRCYNHKNYTGTAARNIQAFTSYPNADQNLRHQFWNANNVNNFRDAVHDLVRVYKLQRSDIYKKILPTNPMYQGIAQVIVGNNIYGQIRILPRVFNNITQIQQITNNLNASQQDYSVLAAQFCRHTGRRTMPDTSFSKLLHFLNPETFPIVDSRVQQNIHRNFAYGNSPIANAADVYQFIQSLVLDPLFSQFIHHAQQANQFRNPHGDPLFKLIDKILF